jgi:hypothetical protein
MRLLVSRLRHPIAGRRSRRVNLAEPRFLEPPTRHRPRWGAQRTRGDQGTPPRRAAGDGHGFFSTNPVLIRGLDKSSRWQRNRACAAKRATFRSHRHVPPTGTVPSTLHREEEARTAGDDLQPENIGASSSNPRGESKPKGASGHDLAATPGRVQRTRLRIKTLRSAAEIERAPVSW